MLTGEAIRQNKYPPISTGAPLRLQTLIIMKTVFLSDLELDGEISRGYMTLIGSTGIHYRTPALNIPGYGWIPCSRKLKNFMTTDPDGLLLVISGGGRQFPSGDFRHLGNTYGAPANSSCLLTPATWLAPNLKMAIS